jgi:hypothetical protein
MLSAKAREATRRRVANYRQRQQELKRKNDEQAVAEYALAKRLWAEHVQAARSWAANVSLPETERERLTALQNEMIEIGDYLLLAIRLAERGDAIHWMDVTFADGLKHFEDRENENNERKFYTRVPDALWRKFVKTAAAYFRRHPNDENIDRELARRCVAEFKKQSSVGQEIGHV